MYSSTKYPPLDKPPDTLVLQQIKELLRANYIDVKKATDLAKKHTKVVRIE